MPHSTTPGGSQRRLIRGGLAAALGLTLIIGSQQQGLTAAATMRRDPVVKLRADKPIEGQNAVAVPRTADPAQPHAVRAAPRVRWPEPGAADVTLPRPGSGNPWVAGLAGDRVTDRAQAGDLPIWMAPAAASAVGGPSTVEVELLGRQGDTLRLKLRRTDGVGRTGRITLGVDYRAFRDAFGGDWATRLRLVTEHGKVIPTRNNGSGQLAAEVPVSPEAQTFAVAAGPSSGAGDYKRSELSDGAATWSIGGSSGDFEWSLPLAVPPGIGGPQPNLMLQYSSGGVDGQSSTTNNQTSLVGQGFDLGGGGAIERRYKSCAKDKGGNNGTRETGDLCFAGDTLNIAVNGKTASLVLHHRDATGEVWRMKGDDGAIVERLSGAANGDDGIAVTDKGEHWRMTAKDGTRFYFGLNRLPGWVAGNPETKSAWTAPVFGNHSGEQCNRSTFATSWCQQAYRWNLDYVVDRHGNTMSYFYDSEIDRYARDLTAASVSSYVRSGTITRIEYGQRDGQVFAQKPVAQVLFTTAERCTPQPCGPGQPATYPDTPWDLTCASTTNCNNHYTPTFWTQKRLAKITTQVWRANNNRHEDVQSWTLRHDYLRGDNTGPALWLEAIGPAGHAGPAIQMPEINFDGEPKDNRVDTTSDMVPPLQWFRVKVVHYGTGGDLNVSYSATDCTPTSLPAEDTNNRRCRPQKWTPEGGAERQDWFHKYVVTQVTQTDRTAAPNAPSAPVPMTVTVQYLDPPSWHFDELDAVTTVAESTWSQWRGHGRVRVTKGIPGETQTVTESLYYRGMDGDRTASGGAKDVKIVDSTGAVQEDIEDFTGQVREEVKYNGAAVTDKSITDYWRSEPTATMVRPWGTLEARIFNHKRVTQFLKTDSGYRQIATEHVYDAAGRLIAKDMKNDVSTPADDACTRLEYVANPARGLLEFPARELITSTGCDEQANNAQVVSDDRVYYDNATSHTAPPTRGVLTKAERLSGFDSTGNPTYETVFTAGYDAIGRQTSVTNALDQTVRKVITPAYGPVTAVVEVRPNGHETTHEFEPAFGDRIAVTDPDNRRTESTLDALGRPSKTWKPGHSKASDPADIEYEYVLRDDGVNAVTTKTRRDGDSVDLTLELYDGLLRLRQTQEPTPNSTAGRLVTDYRYDSRGNRVEVNGPYPNSSAPATQLLLVDPETLPRRDLTVWDTEDRPTAQIVRSFGTEKWRTSHDMNAARQTVDPPTGQAPTSRIVDARGRLIELRQYLGESPTGAYDKTTYSYDPSGRLKTVTDPAGNAWSYDYDLQGRKIRENDPDKGITTYGYDGADRMTSSADARGIKLVYAYDTIGRKKAIHRDSLQGPKLSEWTYDTLAKGKPTSSTRYVGTNAYTTAITGYDTAGRPTGTSVTLPASEGRLAGTYTIGQTYTDDDQVATRTLPQVAGLAAETLTYGYNHQGLPTTLRSELGGYVQSNTYTAFEETEVMTLDTGSGRWVQQLYEYDDITRRVSRVVTDKATSPRRVSDTTYGYDPAGNVTKISDKPSSTTGEPTDTQCFTYDYLRRLTSAWTPASGDCAAIPTAASLGGPAPYFHKWTFDKTGNRKSEQKITAAGTTTSTYEYGSAKPHALTSITTSGPAGTSTKTFGYDATGNTSNRTSGGVSEVLGWDEEGRLKDVTKGGTRSSFVYDTDGNRLLRKDPSGTTLYLGETEVHLGMDGTTLTGTRYYSFDEKVVAVRTAGKLTWLLGDLHKTPTIAINEDNQTVQRRRTTPYGELRGTAPPAWPGQRDFHGGTSDPATGLVNLGAREYDPTTGRFISVDPVIDPEDPQQLNGYAYANNNPTSFDDSNGMVPIAIVVPVILIYVAVVFIYMILVEITKVVFQETRIGIRHIRTFDIWTLIATVTAQTYVYTVTVVREVVRYIEHLIVQYVIQVVIKWVKKIIDNGQKPPRNQKNPDRPRVKPDNPGKKPPARTKPPQKPKRPDHGKKPRKDNRGSKPDKGPENPITRERREELDKLIDYPGKTPRVDPSKLNTETRTPWQPPNRANYDSKDFGSYGPTPNPGTVIFYSIGLTSAGVAAYKFFEKLGWLP